MCVWYIPINHFLFFIYNISLMRYMITDRTVPSTAEKNKH